ncbi:hypothetical protein ScPMuIL_001393 [Solemya velum]
MGRSVLVVLWILVFTRPCKPKNVGWIWHVTDFHWDFTYDDRRLSCREYQADSGPFGDFWCDSPWRLCQEAVNIMTLTKPKVDFVLWTGDNVLHGKDEDLNLTRNNEILTRLTSLLSDAFPDIPIYPTFGNHDYWPTDQFPAHGNTLYNLTLENWKQWINDTVQENNFLKGAYYTVKTQHDLRIIALNTNLYYTSNKMTKDMKDPADQFQWLELVLSEAATKKEKVLVTGHVPPGIYAPGGFSWMYKQFNEAFNDLMIKHSDVIVGLHFGHSHADLWSLYRNSAGEPVVPVFMAPSVTPWRYKISASGHNPAVRLIKYDRDDGSPLDISNYYMDLDLSNKNNRPEWQISYNMTTGYDIPDVTPSSLARVIGRMKTNMVPLQNYNKWRFANAPANVTVPCDDKCSQEVLCSLDHLDIDDFNSCLQNVSSGSGIWLDTIIIVCTFILYFFKIES